MKRALETEDEEISQKWDQMIKDMAAGRIAILDILKISYSKKAPEQDYFEHIQRTRAFMAMLRDKRLVLKLAEEITELGKRESTAFESGVQQIDKTVRSKDGYRRFQKLMDIQSEVFADAPSLLNGKNFDECLKQYLSIISYVEGLWADACSLFNRQHYPLATFTSILVIEEIGKLGRFPWEFERMIEAVIVFEESAGFNPAVVRGGGKAAA